MKCLVETEKDQALKALDHVYAMRLSRQSFPLKENYEAIDTIRHEVGKVADGQNDVHLLTRFCDNGLFFEEVREIFFPTDEKNYPIVLLRNWLEHIQGAPERKYGVEQNILYHLRKLGVNRPLLFDHEIDVVNVIPHRILFALMDYVEGVNHSSELQQYLAFVFLLDMMCEQEVAAVIRDKVSPQGILESLWNNGKGKYF